MTIPGSNKILFSLKFTFHILVNIYFKLESNENYKI